MRWPVRDVPHGGYEYVIRRTPSLTFGRCACKGSARRIQSTALADGHNGMDRWTHSGP